jgi:hypothetical protein
LVHVVAGILLLVAVDVGVELIEGDSISSGFIGEVYEGFISDPVGTSLTVGVFLLSVELGLVSLAWLLAGWGAVDEPLFASYRHALRRVWLQSGQAVVVALMIFCAVFAINTSVEAWQDAHEHELAALWEELHTDVDHDEFIRKWQRIEDLQWKMEPWYVRLKSVMTFWTMVLSTAWLLWSLLRSVGIRRNPAAAERPPTCETCGYNLTGLSMDGRCPECGTAVADSLGDDHRQGSPWDRRRRIGYLSAWWQCLWNPIVDPYRFARQLRACSETTVHRGYLLINVALTTAAIGLAASAIWAVMTSAYRYDTQRMLWENFCILVAGAGLIGGLFALAFCLFSAGLIALWYRWLQLRSLLAAAFQCASYLSGYLLLATVLSMATGMAMMVANQQQWFSPISDAYDLPHELLTAAVWFVITMLCLLVYIPLLLRATAGTRYANK